MARKIKKCTVIATGWNPIVFEVGQNNIKSIYRILDDTTKEPVILIRRADGSGYALNNLQTILEF